MVPLLMTLDEKKLDRYDQIFADMKANGFQEAQSLEDNVEIAWCADGQPLLIDGRRRLALAQILRLPRIPVVANLISEQPVASLAEPSGFLKQQLESCKIKERLKLFDVVEGGKRNKEVLVNPNRSLF